MKFIKNLFSKNSTSKSSLENISEDIFGGSYVISHSTLEGFSEIDKEVAPKIHLLLCAGLINLIDRHIFSIAPMARSNFMNQLINSVATKYVNFYQIERKAEVSSDMLYDSVLSQLNNYQIYLGQFKKLGVTNAGEEIKNTFNWEFGKIFSQELNQDNDPVFILLGSEQLSNLLSTLNLIDKVSYLKIEN
jgi:hypothetical protein